MALFVLSYVPLFDAVPACDRRTDGQTQCHSIYCAVRARAVIKRLCCRPTVVQHGVDKVKVLTDMAVAELLVVVCMDMDLYIQSTGSVTSFAWSVKVVAGKDIINIAVIMLLMQMFVRLFVDENLDRVSPISKQPKDKIQAILEACGRQFPEFHVRSRKRIRTYLKSCRRLRRCKDMPDSPQVIISVSLSVLNSLLEMMGRAPTWSRPAVLVPLAPASENTIIWAMFLSGCCRFSHTLHMSNFHLYCCSVLL